MLLRAPGRGNNKATLPDLKNGCTGHAGARIKRRLHEVASIAGRYECTGVVGLGMFDNEHRDGGHTCLERPRKYEQRKIYAPSLPGSHPTEDLELIRK